MGSLLNATQAIDGRGNITIRSYQGNGYVCIDIADNGNGMPPRSRSASSNASSLPRALARAPAWG